MPFQAEQAKQEEAPSGQSPRSAVGTNFQSVVDGAAATADSQLRPDDSLSQAPAHGGARTGGGVTGQGPWL